jgi:hypothetical protein
MAGKYEQRNEQGDHVIKDDDPSALVLLKEEHRIFRRLFDEAETAQQERLLAIARELCMRLSVHMTIEEEILYPACREAGDAEEVEEGIVEHAAGKRICAELEQLDGTEELFRAKVHVLGEVTVHHLDEEDEDLFETAKEAAAAGKLDLEELGGRLRARQAELYDQIIVTGETGPTAEAMVEEIPEA